MCASSSKHGARLTRVSLNESVRWSGKPPQGGQKCVLEQRRLGWSSGPVGHPLEPTHGMERKIVFKVRAQLGAGVSWRVGGGSQAWKRAAQAPLSHRESEAAVRGQQWPFCWELWHRGSPASPSSHPSRSIPVSPLGASLPALPCLTRACHTSRDLTRPQWNFRTWR